ncbi:MAG: RluA family pseudouridine synthase [candidate division SR1 bacterium]|nr:RluA family pseudouridine synthase [candidate division SR1 bacterium]
MIVNRIRLHKAVTLFLKSQKNLDYTHPEIQRNIENYGVFVDELEVFNRMFWVQPGQSIHINNWPKREHGDFNKVRILEENENFLLLFKPFGVVVQPGAGHTNDNLVEWLLKKYPEQQKFDSTKYPSRGLVHRLDKNTQGLMIVAKNLETLIFLQNQFKERKVVKKYLCIAEGLVEKQYIVKAYQTRDKIDVKRQKLFWDKDLAKAYDSQSRFAFSIIRPIAISHQTNQSLVEIEIKTGRMHQVRLHMQALGFTLVSDHVYTKKVLENTKYEQDSRDFESGWYSFYPLKMVQNVSEDQMSIYKNDIFDNQSYCLLSNYLKISLSINKILEADIINTNNLN